MDIVQELRTVAVNDEYERHAEVELRAADEIVRLRAVISMYESSYTVQAPNELVSAH